MALNASGPISLAGCTVGQSIAKELGLSGTAQIGLNCANVRTLLGVASGAIAMSSAYGKSNEVVGQIAYAAAGSYCFVVPSCVTSISAVVVGAGGGGGFSGFSVGGRSATGAGGGGLSYVNNISVAKGQTVAVVVGKGGNYSYLNGFRGDACGSGSNGGFSSITYQGSLKARANGGIHGKSNAGCSVGGAGGTVHTGTGGAGGRGGGSINATNNFPYPYGCCPALTTVGYQGGGGAAGGYGGAGGRGGDQLKSACSAFDGYGLGQDGAGGGGGGGAAGNTLYSAGTGGGVGMNGEGASGTGGGSVSAQGKQGSPGGDPNPGRGSTSACGGCGGVRIIYPGCKRTYPSTGTGDK